MDMLEMTDSELYEMGFKALADKLGTSEVPRFIRQCQPGKGDYSVDRHKLLANQPNIAIIVKRIRDRQPAREAEERARAERFAAPQNEIKKMTDLEVCEIGSQVLLDKLGSNGLIRFIQQCQELNGGPSRDIIENMADAKENIKLHTAGLTLSPKMVEGYVKRGNAYSYIHEYDKAIADYTEAIRLKPHYAKAHYLRGVAYGKKAEYGKALVNYTKAIELNSKDANVYYNRGKLYDESGEYNKVVVDFGMAIKLEPKHADAYGCRATLYRDQGEYRKAIEDYNREIELRPDDAETYYDRGNTYGEKGEYDKASEDYSKAIELAPKFTEAYVKRGLAYFQIGKFECAIRDYDKVLELKPKFIEVYAARGIIYLHIEKWESAKLDLIFAANLRVDIINAFHKLYESVEDFEQKNDVQLPEDIATILKS